MSDSKEDIRNGQEEDDLFSDNEDNHTSQQDELINGHIENDSEAAVSDDGLFSNTEEATEAPEADVPVKKVLEVAVPNFKSPASASNDVFHAHIPNFLSVEQTPYDPEQYAAEAEADAALLEHDAHWGQRIKHKVDNTVRWQLGPSGSYQSNAQIVQWSDGSYSLRIGNDIYDTQNKLISQPTFVTASHEAQHLLRVQTSFKSSFTFLPSAINAATRSKLPSMRLTTVQVPSRSVQEIIIEKDPELLKRQAEKYEEERSRARRRLEKRKQLNNYQNGTGEEEEDYSSFYGPRSTYSEQNEIIDSDRMDRLKRIKQEGAGQYRGYNKDLEENDEDDLGDFIAEEEEEEEQEDDEEDEEEVGAGSDIKGFDADKEASVARATINKYEDDEVIPSAVETDRSETVTETSVGDGSVQRRVKRRIVESDSE